MVDGHHDPILLSLRSHLSWVNYSFSYRFCQGQRRSGRAINGFSDPTLPLHKPSRRHIQGEGRAWLVAPVTSNCGDYSLSTFLINRALTEFLLLLGRDQVRLKIYVLKHANMVRSIASEFMKHLK